MIHLPPLHKPTLLLVLLFLLSATSNAAEFNNEIAKRVSENLAHFMSLPIHATGLAAQYFELGGFRFGLKAPDRANALRYLFSQVKQLNANCFWGLEDGTFYGYNAGFESATYREPGESGYIIDIKNDTTSENYKHWIACVNSTTGQEEHCRQKEGDKYVEWTNGGELSACPGNSTIPTLCRSYEIVTSNFSQDLPHQQRGIVPRTYHCIDPFGQVSEERGRIIQDYESNTLGDCTYGDKTTLVQRSHTAGDYAYCHGEICNDTFTGAFRNRDYDPRFRGWYINCKKAQRPQWSDPYPFFNNLQMGISFYQPFYSTNINKDERVFEGVVVADYLLSQLATFLTENYGDSDVHIAIVEHKAPHYVIAASTGTSAAQQVLTADPTQPCPAAYLEGGLAQADCKVIRIPIDQIQGQPHDDTLKTAFAELAAAEFPQNKLLGFTASNTGKAYVAQSQLYEQPNANLQWQLIIVMPTTKSDSDSILPGDAMFVALVLIAGLGFLFCAGFFWLCYSNRLARAFVFSDWRFQVAFLIGCCLFNLATLSLLGEATDALCLTRMWSLCICFSLTLSPLFVKVWRMYKLTGARSGLRRRKVTNLQAGLRVLPMVALQAVILIVFTIVDPPVREEILEINAGTDGAVQPTQYILCSHDTNAFYVTQAIFALVVVMIGSYLAFMTRNLRKEFGEAKPLALSMYNIGFAGVIITVILAAVDMERNAQMLMVAVGVFWGTVLSAACFVIPRFNETIRARILADDGQLSVASGAVSVGGVSISGLSIGGSSRHHKNTAMDSSAVES